MIGIALLPGMGQADPACYTPLHAIKARERRWPSGSWLFYWKVWGGWDAGDGR